jgi:hypothetical protein
VSFLAENGTLYAVGADGRDVRELAGGFDLVHGIAAVGPDIILSGTRRGQTGLWRWVRATGSVDLLAGGLFPSFAASPDGKALAAARPNGDSDQIVRVDLT